MSDKITTKAALLEYMTNNPDKRLEWCSGIRSDGWWWVRGERSSNTVSVHANAARALVKAKLVERVGVDFRSAVYALRLPNPPKG